MENSLLRHGLLVLLNRWVIATYASACMHRLMLDVATNWRIQVACLQAVLPIQLAWSAVHRIKQLVVPVPQRKEFLVNSKGVLTCAQGDCSDKCLALYMASASGERGWPTLCGFSVAVTKRTYYGVVSNHVHKSQTMLMCCWAGVLCQL